MNQQNILNFNDIIATYKKLDPQRLSLLKERGHFLLQNNNFEVYSYLVGKIMGDGHLSKDFTIIFVDNFQQNLEILRKLISITFAIPIKRMKIKVKKSKGTVHHLQLNDSFFGRILYCLGAPQGNKTKQAFSIPAWVRKDQKYLKRFLQAILEDELATIKIEKMNHSIKPKFKMAKEESHIPELRSFLEELKNAIESFGVSCSQVSKEPKLIKDRKTKDLYFDILRNKRNILKFEEKIGFFLNNEKQRQLANCCAILRDTLQTEVDKEKIFSLRNEGLSIREIAKRIPHSSATVHRVLNKQKA